MFKTSILKGDKTDSESIDICAAQKTAVVVLNAGGSAAPIIAKLLTRLGCDASASSMGNKSSAIAMFNDAVIQSSGTSVNHWAGFNRQWLSSPKAAEFLGKALELLQSEFGGSYLTVIDDSSVARLLPFWNVVFERAGVLPRYLFVMEDPAELAEDLIARVDVDTRSAHLIWLRTALDAEFCSRGKLRAFVDAASLGSNPAAVMNGLTETLKLILPRDVRAVFASADGLLEELRRLVHRRYSADHGNTGALAMADWVTATYMTFATWAADGETADAQYILDAVREAFDDAVPAFIGFEVGSTKNAAKLRELEQDLEAAQAETRRSQEIAKQIEEAAKLEAAQAEARMRLAEEAAEKVHASLRGRISHLESALAQRKAEVDDTGQLLDNTRREISSMKQELAALRASAREEADDLRQLVEDGAKSLEDAQEQLHGRHKEIVTLTRMLASENAAVRKFERKAERLGAIAQIFEQGAGRGAFARRLGWLLPWRWHFRRIMRSIEREGLFDANAYLTANPDVARAGIDPFRHYLLHGADEGRPLGIE